MNVRQLQRRLAGRFARHDRLQQSLRFLVFPARDVQLGQDHGRGRIRGATSSREPGGLVALTVRERCREVAAKFEGADPLRATCELIEGLAPDVQSSRESPLALVPSPGG